MDRLETEILDRNQGVREKMFHKIYLRARRIWRFSRGSLNREQLIGALNEGRCQLKTSPLPATPSPPTKRKKKTCRRSFCKESGKANFPPKSRLPPTSPNHSQTLPPSTSSPPLLGDANVYRSNSHGFYTFPASLRLASTSSKAS